MQANELTAGRMHGVLAQMGVLKTRLLLERLDATAESETHAAVFREADEAERVAWTTQFPLLIFPCLFEERAAAACAQARVRASLYWKDFKLGVPIGTLVRGDDTPVSVPENLDPGRYLMCIRQRYARSAWGALGHQLASW